MSKETRGSPTKEKLRRCEEKYYSLFKETNDAIFLLDLDGVHFEVNERAAQMLGYSVEELEGTSFRDIIYQDEIENAESRLETLMRGENPPLYERTFRHKDGSLIRAELNAALIRDKDGKPLHIQSIVRDISKRKLLEQSLRENERLYRLLAENAKDVIATLDMDLKVTYASPSVKDLLGFEMDELMSRNISELLTPNSIDIVTSALTEALRLEHEVGMDYDAPPLELEILHKKGHTVWVDASRVFLRDADHTPIGVLIIVRDITKRKLIEVALQRSEHRYREMIESNPEGITIVDFEEKILFCNQAFGRMIGYDPQELVGMNVLEFLPPEDREKVRRQTQQRTEGVASAYQVEIQKRDGETRAIRVSAVPWRNDEGEVAGAIGVISDVTERVQAENELAASNRDLELYTSLLKHDLRNDLQIILTQVEAATILLPKDSDVMKVFEVTQSAAERMKQMINTFDIPEEELTDRVMSLLETRARHAEKAHAGLEVTVVAEEDCEGLRVQQGRLLPALFDNLLRNSYQHAGPEVRVTMKVSSREGHVVIDVIDSGPGISKALRKKVFERDFSLAGKGQGLYLCRRIAEAYGGSIELSKEVSTGASFRVVLPLS